MRFQRKRKSDELEQKEGKKSVLSYLFKKQSLQEEGEIPNPIEKHQGVENRNENITKKDDLVASESAKNFIHSINGQIEKSFAPYLAQYSKPSASELGERKTILTIGNSTKPNFIFTVKICGIGNNYYEQFVLKRGESKTLYLESGTYQITQSCQTNNQANAYIKNNGAITENDHSYYKKRSDGTNLIDSIVELKSGNYNLFLCREMTHSEFKKLLKQLERAAII